MYCAMVGVGDSKCFWRNQSSYCYDPIFYSARIRWFYGSNIYGQNIWFMNIYGLRILTAYIILNINCIIGSTSAKCISFQMRCCSCVLYRRGIPLITERGYPSKDSYCSRTITVQITSRIDRRCTDRKIINRNFLWFRLNIL